MRNPFCLIKVQSEGAKRLAWLCSVVASFAILTAIGCTAIQEKADSAAVVILVMAVAGPSVFFLVGYLVIGITWVIEGFRKNKSN
jgi:hypothetical protein